jgi:LysM domain
MAIHDPSAGAPTAPTESPLAAEVGGDAGTPKRADRRRDGTAPPREGRARNPWVRLLVALTSGTALLGTAGLVAAAAIVPPIGARRTAREAAQQEVASQLGPDERVVAQAFASQRRWTDMWRESFGVVVATNRRLLYVGAPPTPLLRPREDGPTELLVESYPYDVAFTLEPRTLFRGYGRGLVLRTPAAEVHFIVDEGAWASARRVAQASAAARQAVTRDEDALTASTRAPAPPAARYVFYVVRRGETLTALARRFQTAPEVLRQLNQLSDDEIQAGQRLRVPTVDVDSLP